MSSERHHSLDYLRGICAFGIMIFHSICHIYSAPESDSFIAKVGIYGVSMFFILSGITLFHVYQNKIHSSLDVLLFFLKRFFRIFPLLWLCVILTSILTKNFNFKILAINFSALYSFIYRTDYIVEGAWSIGNELYFYVLFPFAIILNQKSRIAFFLVFLFSLALGYYFSYNLLDVNKNLKEQWSLYIHPLNQFFLFTGGMLISSLSAYFKTYRIVLFSLLILSFLLFLLYETNDNQDILLVTKSTRFILSLTCFLICFSVFKLNFKLNNFLHTTLNFIGKISYSIYLLHPIIIMIVLKIAFFKDFKTLQILTIILLSFIFSSLVYYYIEEKFIKLGVVLSSKIKSKFYE